MTNRKSERFISKQYISEGLDNFEDIKRFEESVETARKLREQKAESERLNAVAEGYAREREKDEGEYKRLLSDYKSVWGEIKKLERRYKTVSNPEIISSLNVLENERHDIHQDILEVGRKIGRGKSDVTADILNNEGNLAELGLPEFSIFKEAMDRGNDFYSPERASANTTYLIYDILDSTIGDPYSPRSIIPRLYAGIRDRRANELIKSLGLKLQDFPDGFSHELSHTVCCIAVPNDRLEEIASHIRNDSEKFRLDAAFFSVEEKERAKTEYRNKLLQFLKWAVEDRDSSVVDDLLQYSGHNGNKEEIDIADGVVSDCLKQISQR